jgi:hypothetical protein
VRKRRGTLGAQVEQRRLLCSNESRFGLVRWSDSLLGWKRSFVSFCVAFVEPVTYDVSLDISQSVAIGWDVGSTNVMGENSCRIGRPEIVDASVIKNTNIFSTSCILPLEKVEKSATCISYLLLLVIKITLPWKLAGIHKY